MATRISCCCEFTYESDKDWGVTRTARGTKYSWSDLCIEFNRQGPSCPATNVIHFKTISEVGPKLFAVNCDTFNVFYHSEGQWHQYESARNVRLGTLEELTKLSDNNDDDNYDEDLSKEDTNGEDRDDESSRQAKDSSSNNDSRYQTNQAILYYCLFRLLFFVRLQFNLVPYRSLIR